MRGSPYQSDDDLPQPAEPRHTPAEAARRRRAAKVPVGRRA
jgi:hypothetical protein